MRDIGHEQTDKLLSEMEKKIAKEYKQAVNETQAKLDDYLRKFEEKDKKWLKMVENGEKTQKEYQEWRTGQIMIGQRWEEMRNSLAEDYHNANVIARSTVEGYMPDVYALNHNYATYEIEKGTQLDTSYTLYDRQTVERIIKDNPNLLPPPGKDLEAKIASGKDILWEEGQIQSVTMQSILQGESIPNMAKRICETMGDNNYAASVRYARTAVTEAENAGRHDAYARAVDMGIKMKQMWLATLDNRTRHEHRILDGQTVDVDESFEIDGYQIAYPGDPDAPGYLVWNCRCTTIAQLEGFEHNAIDIDLRNDSKLGSMSYEEWKTGKEEYERTNTLLTNQVLERARSEEPGATAMLKKAVNGTSGHLEGLDYRLKGEESLSRKIHDKSIEKDVLQKDYAPKITDALRYTVVSPTDDLTSTFKSVEKSIRAQGYSLAEVTNTLRIEDAPYRGINTLVRTENGYLFELQFHTPESLDIKEINHVLYERQRLITTSGAEKKELAVEMARNAKSIPTPRNIDQIKDVKL